MPRRREDGKGMERRKRYGLHDTQNFMDGLAWAGTMAFRAFRRLHLTDIEGQKICLV